MWKVEGQFRAGKPSVGEFRLSALTFVSAAATALVIVLPLLLNAYLPFEDLPNHIARRYIMSGVDPALAKHFQLKRGVATNSAVDLAWQIRIWAAPVSAQAAIAFSRWAIGFAMLGFVGSIMILHRVLHARWSPWPLLSGLLVYNGNVLWGFENYIVTVPLGILGFVLWITSRRAAPLLRLTLTLGVVAILYLGHVLVLMAYTILVIGYEAGRKKLDSRAPDFKAVDWLGLSVVIAACLAHLLLLLGAPKPGFGTATNFGPLSERAQVILSPFGAFTFKDSMLQPLLDQSTALLCIILSGLLVLLRLRVGTIQISGKMKGPLLLLGLATLLMPTQLSGVYFTHIRFPVLLLGLLIATVDLKLKGRHATALATILTAALLAAIAVRAFVLDRATRAYSDQISVLADLTKAVRADMPVGARVLPVLGQQADPLITRHFHSAAYLVLFGDVFVPTLFVSGSHGLGMAPGLEHLSAPQPQVVHAEYLDLPAERWTPALDEAWAFAPGWTKNFSHVLVFGSVKDNFASKFCLRPLATRKAMTVFKLETKPETC